MKSYDGIAVDLYMRSTLEQDLTEHETDNALTLLTTLTTIAPTNFPHGHTFVQVSKTRPRFYPEAAKVRGIQLYTIHGNNETRSVFIPRAHLVSLKVAMNSLFEILGNGYTLKDL